MPRGSRYWTSGTSRRHLPLHTTQRVARSSSAIATGAEGVFHVLEVEHSAHFGCRHPDQRSTVSQLPRHAFRNHATVTASGTITMVTGHQHPPRGLDLGYARISSTKQSLDRQLDALATAGISIDPAERAGHARAVAQAAGGMSADHSPTEQTRSGTLGCSRPRVTPVARSAPRPASRRPHCTATSQMTRSHRRLRR